MAGIHLEREVVSVQNVHGLSSGSLYDYLQKKYTFISIFREAVGLQSSGGHLTVLRE